jgi:hypothetical protein
MRTRFDQFAKQMAGKALAAAGTVRTDEEVSPDAGHVDIWFTPHTVGPPGVGDVASREVLASLGMLGRIGQAPFTMEPFHRTPSGHEVMGCVCKHHHFRNLLARRSAVTAASGARAAPEMEAGAPPEAGDGTRPLPVQWIVSSGRPTSALEGLRFDAVPTPEWGPGVYDGPPLTSTRLVVVTELPDTPDTLLLRLMGAGRVLARALEELRSLPNDALERALALPLLVSLRIDVPAEPEKRNEDDEEYIMAMQSTLDTYIEQWKREGLAEGRNQGRAEGRDQGRAEGYNEKGREDLLEVYTMRFGSPPADIAAIIAGTDNPELLRSWLKLLVRGSAEEVTSTIRAGRTPSAP